MKTERRRHARLAMIIRSRNAAAKRQEAQTASPAAWRGCTAHTEGYHTAYRTHFQPVRCRAGRSKSWSPARSSRSAVFWLVYGRFDPSNLVSGTRRSSVCQTPSLSPQLPAARELAAVGHESRCPAWPVTPFGALDCRGRRALSISVTPWSDGQRTARPSAVRAFSRALGTMEWTFGNAPPAAQCE